MGEEGWNPAEIGGALARALGIERGSRPLIALVGGGGKTSAMLALASALATEGWRVVTSTTTRLVAGQRDESAAWCLDGDEDALAGALDRHGQCLVVAVGGEVSRGLSIERVAALAARPDVDAVIVEADGSRRRPLKAPAPHEPVLPPGATHIIAIVGADAFGEPLDGLTVHRPERAAALLGVESGAPITPALVARLLLAENGGRQYVPPGARFIPFLNKAETERRRARAAECAARLLANPAVDRVLIGSLRGPSPFVARWVRDGGDAGDAGENG